MDGARNGREAMKWLKIAGSIVLLGCIAQSAKAQGHLLIANKSDDTLDVVDLETGRSVHTYETGRAPHEVAVSADGVYAVVANYGRADGRDLTWIDLQERTAKKLSIAGHRGPHGVVWLAAGFLVTAEGTRELLHFDSEANLVQAIGTGQLVSHMVTATPDEKLAFVANLGSGSVTVIDLVEGSKIKDIRTGRGAEGIATSPDGAEVWVTNRDEDTVSIIDVERLRIVETIDVPSFPIRAEITADGAWVLVSAAGSGEVVLIDRVTRQIARRASLALSTETGSDGRLFAGRFGESPVPIGIEVDPSGERIWVAATRSDVVVEMSLPELAVQRVLTAGRQPDGLALAP